MQKCHDYKLNKNRDRVKGRRRGRGREREGERGRREGEKGEETNVISMFSSISSWHLSSKSADSRRDEETAIQM